MSKTNHIHWKFAKKPVTEVGPQGSRSFIDAEGRLIIWSEQDKMKAHKALGVC